MNDRESVIAKVQKLLALANEAGGGTEAEREAAMAKAERIMFRHNLDRLTVEAEAGGMNDANLFSQETEAFDSMADFWKGNLLARIGRVSNVHVHYSATSKRNRRVYRLVGRPDAIAYVRKVTDYLAPWLEIECEAGFIAAKDAGELQTCGACGGDDWLAYDCRKCGGTGKAKLNRRVWRSAFYEAATNRIVSRMKRRNREMERTAGTAGMELIRNDRARLESFVENEFNLRKSYSRRGEGSIGGRMAGDAAGKRADLGAGENLTNNRRQLTA